MTRGAERPALASFESSWQAPSFLPNPALTFPALVAQRIAERPSETAFSVVAPEGRELGERAFSYASVGKAVERAAAELAFAGVVGAERVIVAVAEPGQFFVWFLACQVLGAVPVPLPAANEYAMPAVFRDRIRSVAADCAPRAIVVDSLAGWRSAAPDVSSDIALIDAVALDLETEAPASSRQVSFERSFDECAFIQYTSGSTGQPKGVVVDHYNLIANFRAMAEAGAFSPRDRSFSWLPMFHDMGLVGGFLFGVYMGVPTFVMASRHFILRPDTWLRAVDRYRATYTAAPNFAYSLVARRLPDNSFEGLDLSCLRLACDGAEPVDRSTVEAFVERLEPRGFRRDAFYPVYGLAETTLAAAMPTAGVAPSFDVIDRNELSNRSTATRTASAESKETLSVTSVGRPLPGHRIRVLEPGADDELPERRVGEIAISGPSVTNGYWGTHSSAQTELRTGDLGYLANGELYVVDRLKDLVIIAGRNLAPSDVERVIGRLNGVVHDAVVAFASPGTEGTEELVVVAALEPRARRRADELRDEIRRVVNEHFNVLAKDICIVPRARLPRTSSGKLQRGACRKLYESGKLGVD